MNSVTRSQSITETVIVITAMCSVLGFCLSMSIGNAPLAIAFACGIVAMLIAAFATR